jgi:hypothetical protein
METNEQLKRALLQETEKAMVEMLTQLDQVQRRRSANAGTKGLDGMSLIGKKHARKYLEPCRRSSREKGTQGWRMWTSSPSGWNAPQATAHADGKSDHSACLLPMCDKRRAREHSM